jgi:MFS family permease
VTRELGFEPGVLGVIFGLGGLSSLAGAMLAGRAARRLGLGMALVLGVGMMGVSMLFIPAAGLPLGVAAVFLIAQQLAGDGCFVVFDVNATSLRQTLAPERMLGRVNAFLRILELGSLLTGTLVGGLMGETIGLRPALTIAASMVVLSALWLFVSPARGLREAPEGIAELPYERAPDPAPYQP